MKQIFFLLVLITFLASCEKQKTEKPYGSLIEVPDEVGTIQEALNAAQDNDTILLYPEEYNEWDLFLDKSVFITSLYYLEKDTNIINQTIIDADFNSRVFFIHNARDTIKLNGFTITHGDGKTRNNFHGGGVYCYNSKLLLNNIIIDQNHSLTHYSGGKGGGLYVEESYVKLDNVRITNNSAYEYCGGIYCANSDFYCSNSRIENNHNYYSSGYNLYFEDSYLEIRNSLIRNNPNLDEDYADIGFAFCTGIMENVEIFNDSVDFYESTIELINCTISGH